jgi:hypothetical protein
VPSKSPTRYDKQVFINCPFDDDYWPLLKALLFTIRACGFDPRCARERDDGGEVRMEKIITLISECRLGVHDLSRKGADPAHGLARFNMPFELGIFLGAARFGKRAKRLLILATERFDYQKFISDIAGQDIRSHGDEESRLISQVRDWLNTQRGADRLLPGGRMIRRLYEEFQNDAPKLLSIALIAEDEATYSDWISLIQDWVEQKTTVSKKP